MAALGFHHERGAAATSRGTSFVVSFVVAMNRVDVVDLVVDIVDLDVDVDLVDVDLADIGLVDVDFAVDLDLDRVTCQECFRLLSFKKCGTTD